VGAALIMFFAVAALSTGPQTDLKVAATAFGAGIPLNATVVRGLLVPALVAVFGNWNWWLPAWARWLLRVPALPPTGPAMTQRASACTGHGT
jgi:putative drug exporter of the RND superfamily